MSRTRREVMPRTPIHPGEILKDELDEFGVAAAELARQLEVPANRVSQILAGKRAVTADTALRLARWFGTSTQLRMNLQQTYELDLARQRLGAAIERIPTRDAASPPAAAP
ncbi:MAG TPA: HigA family addiction module antitoxin [Geminicoccaceae bacterium]|nr:HigA family addiction module antitoxin [Geminicoccaceae bacterium]